MPCAGEGFVAAAMTMLRYRDVVPPTALAVDGVMCTPICWWFRFSRRPDKKVRCPSWCDRVLYSVGTFGGDAVRRLALDRYWSSGPLLSDHMPGERLYAVVVASTKS